MGIPLSIDPKKTLEHTCNRQVVALFKEFLCILENLADDHDEALGKLAAALPAEYHQYINLADYFTPDRSDRLRKIVLQKGNDTARAILDELGKYDVEFGGG